MSDTGDTLHSTGTLNTKVEYAFISPLTAIRGALEILRDYPDLTEAERNSFVSSALEECARLEAGIDHLSDAVYAERPAATDAPVQTDAFAERIRFSKSDEIVDLDFSSFVFESTETVNTYFDAVDRAMNATGRKWYVIADHTNCRIWPEAWVAFAHRSKKVNVNFSLGTLKLDTDSNGTDPALVTSRAAAIDRIDALKQRPSWERG